MNKFEHYSQRTVTLLPGDEIEATYRQRPDAPVRESPATLKRLYGLTEGMRYKGVVRLQGKGECISSIYSVVVDLFDTKTNKRQCTHVAYNIEIMIKKGELYDLRHIPNPSPSLFDYPITTIQDENN